MAAKRTRTRTATEKTKTKKAKTKKATTKKPKKLPAALQEMVDQAEGMYGEKVIQRGNDVEPKNRIPTGCFIIDFALMGGLPQGHHAMVYGYHSTAKSTFLLNGLREFQQKSPNQYTVWIDAEGLYDKDWAESIGVDTEKVLLSQPETGELAVDLVEAALGQFDVGLVVLDSVPACVSTAIIEKSAQDDTMAELARLMGKLSSKVTVQTNKMKRQGHQPTFWYVNQLRNKVGFVMGSPIHLPGGFQINHLAAVKLWLKVKKKHFDKDEFGSQCDDHVEQSFKLEKTKYGSCLSEGEFQLLLQDNHPLGLDKGTFDNVHQIYTMGKRYGFITGGGAKWRVLTCRDEDRTFKKRVEIEEWLHSDLEEQHTLARSIIAANRVHKGMTALPPDGYLVSPIGRLVTLQNEEA